LAFTLVVACQSSRESRRTAVTTCPFTPNNIRVDTGHVAGIPITASLGDLPQACPGARLDTVNVGGTQPVALSFGAPGALVSAVQMKYEAYGDSIHSSEPADLWIAQGDSLRFPDGGLMPTTVGALRTLNSSAVIVIDHGDDDTGSYVVPCRYPYLAFIVSNVWPTFADTGAVPFARADVRDTTRFWRVELMPSMNSRVAAVCARAPAT
jgi:hypothetical protein